MIHDPDNQSADASGSALKRVLRRDTADWAPPRRRVGMAAATVLFAVALSACGSSGSGGSGSSASSGSVASADLITAGQITYCADISFPPFEYYLAAGQPTGSDIDLGDALATEMHLKAVWRNVSFNGIIPALQAKQCDAIISGLFDKPSRRKVVDFIDYISIGNTLVVPYGNPGKVTSFASLAGKNVGAESGSTLALDLTAANKVLVKDGQKPMTVLTFPTDSDAFEQLLVGHLSAYYTANSTAAYYSKLHPHQVQAAGPVGNALNAGIATLKSNRALHVAFQAAYAKLQQNGTYLKILTKWDLQSGALK